MKRTIKTLSLILASLSALLFASSCEDDLKPQEQEVDFTVSCTPPQAHIEREGQMVTTQLLVTEQEVECPRPTKYSVSFAYDETVGTLLFLGKSVQSGKPISLSSLTNLSLTYQAKELMGNKVKVTVTNDAPKAVSKEAAWTVTADGTYSVETSQEGQGELVVLGAKDLKRVPAGTKLTVTATPADGWGLVALTANEVDILSSKTFEVTENTMVRATFTQKAPTTYAVTLVKEGEGEVTITGADDLNRVPVGTKLTVTAKPADGWELTVLTANGADILPSESFVVYNPTEVKAVFTKKAPKTYPVTLVKEGDGTVAISGADNLDAVVAGSKLTVTATPADGWEVKSITANGKDITADKTFVVDVATDVKVVFARISFCNVVITYNIEGGNISLRGDFAPRHVNFSPYSASFRQGSKLTLSVQPRPEYIVTSLSVNGKALSPAIHGIYDLTSYTNADKLTIDIKFGKKNVVVTYDEVNQTSLPSPKVQVSRKIGREAGPTNWIDPHPSFTASAGSKMNIQVEYSVRPSVAEPPLKCTVTIGGKAVTLTRARNDRTLYRYLTYVGTFVVPDLDTTLKVVFKN